MLDRSTDPLLCALHKSRHCSYQPQRTIRGSLYHPHFPIIVWLGASGKTTDKRSTQICKFLGDISYPLYAVHYPIMYLFYAWLIDNELYTFAEIWPMAIMVYAGSIALAYLCLKLYDEPVRKWLGKKFLRKNKFPEGVKYRYSASSASGNVNLTHLPKRQTDVSGYNYRTNASR